MDLNLIYTIKFMQPPLHPLFHDLPSSSEVDIISGSSLIAFSRSLTDTPITSPSPPTISFDDSGFDGAASKPLLPKVSFVWDEMNTGVGGGNGRYSSPYMFLTR